MTVLRSAVFLLNVERNDLDPAELWHEITEKQLSDWEGEWMPELYQAMQRLARAGVERARWPQSRHWDWRRKVETLQGMLGHPGFSIVCQDITQGMMILDTASKRCRIEGQRGHHLAYVEFLETAPWNRPELLSDPPRFRGIGTLLIRAAIELSKEHEFKGRIGLHSLPQANNFYANSCGMKDLGPDPLYENLRYFEMTPEQAEAFIAKGTQP